MMTFSSFIWQFCLAWLMIGLAIYIPGRLCVRLLRVDLEPLEHAVVSLMAGTGLFVLIHYAGLRMQLAWLLAVYAMAGILAEAGLGYLAWKRDKDLVPDPEAQPPETWSSLWPLGLLMLAGMMVQGSFTFFTGWITGEGVKLLAWHAHDAPWHIYNLTQLASQYPPDMPGFSRMSLQNYHMFSDLLWGGVLHLAPIHPWHVYFRIAPLFYAGLLTLTTFVAARAWSGKKEVGYLAAIFTVLLSNFGYVIPLLFGAEKYGIWEVIFWVQSPNTLIFNPGVSSSFSILMIGLWALTQWLKQSREWGYLGLLILFWGLLPGFKVYPGLLVIAGLGVAGFIVLVTQRNWKLWLALAAILPLALLVFLPGNTNTASVVQLLPGFNLAAMLVAPDRLAWMTSAELKLLYVQKPFIVVLLMGLMAFLFLVGNLGVRAIGLIPMLRLGLNLKKADPVLVFLTVVIGGAFAAPLLYVQQGVAWNTIQFFYYAVLLSALPAADQVWTWSQRLPSTWRKVFIGVIIVLGLPCTLQSLWIVRWNYQVDAKVCSGLLWLQAAAKPGEVILRPVPDDLVSEQGYQKWKRTQERGRMTDMKAWKSEAEGMATGAVQDTAVAVAESTTLNAISQNTPLGNTPTAMGVLGMTNPLATNAQPTTPTANTIPAPVLAAESTTHTAQYFAPLERTDSAIVAGITLRNTFFEDTVSAQIMSFPVEQRAEAVRSFYSTADIMQARDFLEKQGITYVVVWANQTLPFDPAGVPLKMIFKNEGLQIYKYLTPEGWQP